MRTDLFTDNQVAVDKKFPNFTTEKRRNTEVHGDFISNSVKLRSSVPPW